MTSYPPAISTTLLCGRRTHPSCTPRHVNHVGRNPVLEYGLWVPSFPNARYVLARNEFDYWTEQHAKTPVPPSNNSVLPVLEAKRADIVGNDYEIGDHARILPTP